MPRKSRPLNRDSGVLRDASLIVIASEDKYAVKQYFARFKTRRVQVLVLPTEDGCSSPKSVIDRLNAFVKEHDFDDGDIFWICIDRDRWADKSLAEVVGECHKRGFRVAMSHPCFDLWVLLHFEEVTDQIGSCDEVRQRMIGRLGGYSKQCCQSIALSREMVETAAARAKSMDDGGQPILAKTGTRVYQILDLLIERDAIRFTEPPQP